MRIVVYPHDLGIGGSQLNAIEIAHRTRELGHEVVVFGRPGPLVARINELGLDFCPAPQPGRRPSRRIATSLRRLVERRGIDVVHGYEWPPALESLLACRGTGALAVATVMSMAVAPFVPHTMPLLVGTRQIEAAERLAGRRRVATLEPPVDVESNSVEAVAAESAEFRRQHQLNGELIVVTVTRLAHEMKLEGLLVAIDTVSRRSRTVLVVVGDGPARDEIRAAADAANTAAGRRAVILTGELVDPRPAYAVADVVLGMGSSALRALAFRKPLIVQGEQGFWNLLSPATVNEFRWTGWYGVGSGPSSGPLRLAAALSLIEADPAGRAELGRFGAALVRAEYSLDRAAELQVSHYQRAVGERAGWPERSVDLLGSSTRFAGYVLGRRLARLRGTMSRDDFNARPVAAGGPAAPVVPGPRGQVTPEGVQ